MISLIKFVGLSLINKHAIKLDNKCIVLTDILFLYVMTDKTNNNLSATLRIKYTVVKNSD